MASSKSRSRLLLSIIIFSFGIGIFFMFRGCNSDVSPISSNLLLETKGKRYLFSMLPSDQVATSVGEGKTPAVMNSTLVYKDGEEVFLQPTSLEHLVAILRGSTTIHAMKDGSVDGYLTVERDEGVVTETAFKSTKKLGEQHHVHTVTLENKKGKKLRLEWTYNPKEGTYYGMKHCEVHGFWVQTNPSPGETVWSTIDYLVVPVNTLAKFFEAKIDFDEESELLIIKP